MKEYLVKNIAPRFEISKRKVLEKFDEVRELADFVSYSSKTNPTITKILEKERDCFFSIHSIYELKNIEDFTRVIFLAQGWDFREIDYLFKKGIRFFVVDNEKDLGILKNYLKQQNTKINLFLRLRLKENTLRTEKYFVFGFNSNFIEKEILELKKHPQIQKIGIHFHRKTQNLSEWNLKKEIEDVLHKKTLEQIDYLVLGGGLPSIYANTNIKIFDGIFKKIKTFNEWLNEFKIKTIIEPGRYIAAPSGRLISHIKTMYDQNILVDVSVYNSDLDALIVPIKLLIKGEVEKGKGKPYVIKGSTPCSMDLFRYRVYLSKEPQVGEELIFLNAGAYNFTSNFCDLPMLEQVVVE